VAGVRPRTTRSRRLPAPRSVTLKAASKKMPERRGRGLRFVPRVRSELRSGL
jgi:hypothetical protein